jgi:hypothetical protein
MYIQMLEEFLNYVTFFSSECEFFLKSRHCFHNDTLSHACQKKKFVAVHLDSNIEITKRFFSKNKRL